MSTAANTAMHTVTPDRPGSHIATGPHAAGRHRPHPSRTARVRSPRRQHDLHVRVSDHAAADLRERIRQRRPRADTGGRDRSGSHDAAGDAGGRRAALGHAEPRHRRRDREVGRHAAPLLSHADSRRELLHRQVRPGARDLDRADGGTAGRRHRRLRLRAAAVGRAVGRVRLGLRARAAVLLDAGARVGGFRDR